MKAKCSPSTAVFVATVFGVLWITAGCDEEPATGSTRLPVAVVTSPAQNGLPDIIDGPLRVSPGGVDFGTIAPHSAHQVNLVLFNDGAQPISIIRAVPTCLCTAPQDLTGSVIPPGGSIPFVSGFQAPTETGRKSAKIQLVYSAGNTTGTVMIPLGGIITMPVNAEPTYVDALKGVTDGEVRLIAIDGRPFRILSADGAVPVHADGFDPASGEARSVYTLRWHVPARSTDHCPGARLWWIVETDHPDCPILPLRIRHECTGSLSDPDRRNRGWTFKEPIASLGEIAAGEPVEVEVVLHNRGGIPISAVESLSPDATAELISSERATSETSVCRVRFTPRAGYEGMLYALVLFRSPNGDKDVAFVARVL